MCAQAQLSAHVTILLIQYVVLLTCTSIANDHDRVPNLDQFLQLHHFQDKVVLSLKTKVL